MNTDPANTPDRWFRKEGTFRVPDSPDPGVWVNLDALGGEDPLLRILLWHWHTPTDGPARWSGAGVGKHTLHSLDPLHLEPSLGCDEGCPNHGWIRDGKWTNA